jgi:hypothetical protein
MLVVSAYVMLNEISANQEGAYHKAPNHLLHLTSQVNIVLGKLKTQTVSHQRLRAASYLSLVFFTEM